MPAPFENSPYRLFVEGTDDKWSVVHLLRRHGYDWDDDHQIRPFVKDTGGIDNLLDPLLISTALKSYQRLAFVVDADLHVADRWTRIQELFRRSAVNVPTILDESGFVAEAPGGQRLGVWLMPDNRLPGKLEDFISTLIPPSDPCRQHAYEATTEACNIGATLRADDYIKGVVHSWLAWQEAPGLPFGTALTARLFRHDSPEALAFVAWFKNVFSI